MEIWTIDRWFTYWMIVIFHNYVTYQWEIFCSRLKNQLPGISLSNLFSWAAANWHYLSVHLQCLCWISFAYPFIMIYSLKLDAYIYIYTYIYITCVVLFWCVSLFLRDSYLGASCSNVDPIPAFINFQGPGLNMLTKHGLTKASKSVSLRCSIHWCRWFLGWP